MKSHTEMVREFADTYGFYTPTKPCIPAEEIRDLRRSLNDEENTELYDADTPVKALDAIADLLYVVHGAALAYGFTPEQVDAAFREVHRSNMSKLWDISHTQQSPEDSVWIPVRPIGDKFIVKRADGKILKSPSYSPANLEPIVNGGAA